MLECFVSNLKPFIFDSTLKQTENMTAAIQTQKLEMVKVPAEYQKEEGCVAFQMVKLTYFFYGKEMTEMFDTKILQNGDQIVINGNGFIKDGLKIN